MAGKARGERRARKLAAVVPLAPPEEPPELPPLHGSCQGCQQCIARRCELTYGGKWKLNSRGELERQPEP
jgi:hypothetical protein